MLSRILGRMPFGGTARPRYNDPVTPAVVPHRPRAAPAAGKGDAPAAAAPAPAADERLEKLRSERDALAQRLQRLEKTLSDPEKAQNVILYYRLRAIWDLCHGDLVSLARQFREKYEGRVPAEGTQAQNERLALAGRLRVANAEEKTLRERVLAVRHDLHEREKPFKVGEKQALTQELQELEPRLEEVRKRIAALRHEAAVTPPPTPRTGITLATRRAINTLLIAMAQHYYLHFRDEQIADMALSAARKPVDEVYFGLSRECLALGQKARELVALARAMENRHEVVRRRAQYLNGRLRYADEHTAIPLPESVKEIPTRIAPEGELFTNFGELVPVNVLAVDYWDLSRALVK